MEATSSGPIRLDFTSEKQVLIVPDDQDRFMMTSKEAARACKQVADSQDWHTQFPKFLLHLRDWCQVESQNVRSAYLTVGDSGLNILIYIHSHDYDFEFEDTLVKLDFELAKVFPQCSAELLQIPDQKSLTEKLNGEALCFYGDTERSSGPSQTQQ